MKKLILMLSIGLLFSCTVNPSKEELKEISQIKEELKIAIDAYTLAIDTLDTSKIPIEAIVIKAFGDIEESANCDYCSASDIDLFILQIDGDLYALVSKEGGIDLQYLESSKRRFSNN